MGMDKAYDEPYRPQFHFTPGKNWTNDPNGLVFYQGEYHLFFQHNPEGAEWGNMTWGHAVSTDLLHWQQLAHALHPDKLGTVFSGSAVVDHHNTAGFKTGQESPIVCIYTSAGGTSDASKGRPFTQSIAYSNDRGRTWTKYDGNPVLGHLTGSNRDPKVLWHAPTQRWIMALYLDGNDYALLTSPDLKQWEQQSRMTIPGASECPDFFELAVDGDPNRKKWVFWGASNHYLLGRFDGRTFTPETDALPSNWGANYYAAQTWSDVPAVDSRRLQIAWMAGGQYPGMPFNQQLSFPVELTLHTTPDGVRLCKTPIRELANIRGPKHHWTDVPLKPGENLLAGLSGELFEIAAEIEAGSAWEVGFTLRGEKVRYNFKNHQLSSLNRWAVVKPEENRLRLRILLDRTTLEVFGNDGLVSLPGCFLPDQADRRLAVWAAAGEARLVELAVYELNSVWPQELEA